MLTFGLAESKLYTSQAMVSDNTIVDLCILNKSYCARQFTIIEVLCKLGYRRKNYMSQNKISET